MIVTEKAKVLRCFDIMNRRAKKDPIDRDEGIIQTSISLVLVLS